MLQWTYVWLRRSFKLSTYRVAVARKIPNQTRQSAEGGSVKHKSSRPVKLIVSNQTSSKIRKFHSSIKAKSRVEVLLTNPGEARKALKKLLDADMFELHNKDFDSLTDKEVLSLVKDVLSYTAKLEREERQ